MVCIITLNWIIYVFLLSFLCRLLIFLIDIESKLKRIEEDPEGSGTTHLFNCMKSVTSRANLAFEPLFERQVGVVLICCFAVLLVTLFQFVEAFFKITFRLKLRKLGLYKECFRDSGHCSIYPVLFVAVLARVNMIWQFENTRRRNLLLSLLMYAWIFNQISLETDAIHFPISTESYFYYDFILLT